MVGSQGYRRAVCNMEFCSGMYGSFREFCKLLPQSRSFRIYQYTVISLVYSTLRYGPTRSNSTRPSLDALHLITSTRLLGWSGGLPIPYDPYPEFPPQTDPAKPERTLTQEEVNRKALRVHARYALIHWVILDLLTFSFQTLGRRGIGSPRGGSIYASADTVVRCVQQHIPSLFRTAYGPTITWLIRQLHIVFIHFATGMAFYQGLCFGYHLAALGGLFIFRQDAGQWPRLMNQPLMADSILQFWGKRWHQVSFPSNSARVVTQRIFQIFRVRSSTSLVSLHS